MTHMDTDRINQAVGAELRAARARRGWSRKDLAGRSGVSVASIRRYEGGKRAVPVDALWDLMDELGIDIGDIGRAISRASSDDHQDTSGRDLDATFSARLGELEPDGTYNNGEQVI